MTKKKHNWLLDAMPSVWQICGMAAAISCVFIFSRE